MKSGKLEKPTQVKAIGKRMFKTLKLNKKWKRVENGDLWVKVLVKLGKWLIMVGNQGILSMHPIYRQLQYHKS